MRLFQYLIGVASFCLVAGSAAASPANPQSGVDYRVLDRAQQTEPGKKVEVTEFFWYGCPHCSSLEPDLENWVKKNENNIVFKRVPVAFRESFVPQQKMYYALESMGKIDDMQKKIFAAIHGERKPLDTEAAIVDFVTKHGIDKQKFLELYNSFGIQAKAKRAAQLQEGFRIEGVPTIAIDGRYITSPSIVGAAIGRQPQAALHAATFQVMDHLVAKAATERGTSAQPAAAATPQTGNGAAKAK